MQLSHGPSWGAVAKIHSGTRKTERNSYTGVLLDHCRIRSGQAADSVGGLGQKLQGKVADGDLAPEGRAINRVSPEAQITAAIRIMLILVIIVILRVYKTSRKMVAIFMLIAT